MKKQCTLLAALLLVYCSQALGIQPVADSGYAAKPLTACKTDLQYLNQLLGWQGGWPSKWRAVAAGDSMSAKQSLAEWQNAPERLLNTIARLRQGISAKHTAPRVVAARVQQQVRALSIELRSLESQYLFDDTNNEHAQAWNVFVLNKLAPAVSGFEAFLRLEYLPNAKEKIGLSALEDGRACYFSAVKWWTSLDMTQAEIEKIGWRVLTQARENLAATAAPGESVDEVLERLRSSATSDTTTEAQLLKISEQALARAHEKSQLVFSKRSAKAIVVEKLPVHLQASFPAGRYVGAKPSADTATETLSKYIINPSRPNERRLMAEVIAFHEGIPGHHSWFTYPRVEMKKSRQSGHSGLTEGWALYSEYLADEIGLYSSTFDRQGMMAKHLWAASRLIIEPGIHLNGWSREQAIEFMLTNTLLSRTEVELEVDRYIAMPGQSLSYILGSDFIMSERQRARKILGKRFDIKEFHHAVLASGLRSLDLVRIDIREWVEQSQL